MARDNPFCSLANEAALCSKNLEEFEGAGAAQRHLAYRERQNRTSIFANPPLDRIGRTRLHVKEGIVT